MSARAQALFGELHARGVTVRLRGDDLVLRPKRKLDAALLDKVRVNKADLVALLEQVEACRPHDARSLCAVWRPGTFESPDEPGPPPILPEITLLPADPDPDRPPHGWIYVLGGNLAGCWVGPNGELDSGIAKRPETDARPNDDPPPQCFACRRTPPAWWRLADRSGPWVCTVCHPPQVGMGVVERWQAPEPSWWEGRRA